eukprot:TRINITY_DN10090_c0_g1_i1.p1 TRINITY_DN10090_c0_g1~~TRINITY_DN10090_c0_g1_i1.p1  ORF type:complete len:892 (-),score=174.91 TRINITY_DN10090_c0_g1_i1:69-2744(-)
MVHVAFSSALLIDKLPLKIESIETWGGRLLVGTAEGVLFIYEVKEKDKKDPAVSGRSQFSVSLLDAQKSFTNKKPIQQLSVVELPNTLTVLLSLSDGYISIHDLPSFNQRGQLSKAKGCHAFAIDTARNPPVLCAAIKKKIIIFTWNGSEFVDSKELPVADTARAVAWCGDNLCVGFKRDYNIFNLGTGEVKELFPTGKTQIPQINVLPNEQLLLGKDNISIFIGFDGKPTRKYGLSWSETPLEIAYAFPYVIGLLPSKVEVRSAVGSQSAVQSIQLRFARWLTVRQTADPQQPGEIYCAAANQIWRLVPVPIGEQIEQLVGQREYEDALLLCETMPPGSSEKKAKIKEIKVLYTYHLFSQGQYERAMEYFQDLNHDPLQVIGLFPAMLPREVQLKYPPPVHDMPELAGAARDKALKALCVFLSHVSLGAPLPPLPDPTQDTPAVLDELDYGKVRDGWLIIDTSLLKAYLKTQDPLLVSLLRRPNHCHLGECERLLNDQQRYYELMLLYRGKGFHRLALELLARLGQQARGTPTLAPHGINMSGPNETITYLSSLGRGQLNLIFEFSCWCLQTQPDQAIQIFTAPRTDDTALPAAPVLAHVKQHAPELVVPYLEHVIQRGETGAEFHNELIFTYLDMIMVLKRDAVSKPETSLPPGSEPGLLGQTRAKLLAFLASSQHYMAERMLSRFPFDDLFEERAILLSRIGQHKEALHIYAHKLQAPLAAEAYCQKHYDASQEGARDVYLSLLRVYLQPADDMLPMVSPALALLNKHYKRINIPKALELFPASVPLKDLYPVLECVLQDNTQARRNGQVLKNLLKSENLQIQEQLIGVRSRVVKMTEDRMCLVCNKRIGFSVFACYPNGTVVHYFCCKDKSFDPVLKMRFPVVPQNQ